MRNGWLCSLVLLAGSGGAAVAQPWPGYGPPAPGYPVPAYPPMPAAYGPAGPGGPWAHYPPPPPMMMRPPMPPAPMMAGPPQPPFPAVPVSRPTAAMAPPGADAPGVASTATPPPAPAKVVAPAVPVAPPVVEYEAVGEELTPLPPAAGPVDDFDGPARPRQDRFWIFGDALAGWVKPGKLVPIVTTGSTADPAPGALGQPGTRVLFGDQNLDSLRLGFRTGFGVWLDHEHHGWSLDVSGFYLLPEQQRFVISSDNQGFPVIIRPAFDVVNQREAAFLVAQPTLAAGTSTTEVRSELWGTEANVRHHHCWASNCTGEAFVGFRQLRLDESLRVFDQVRPLAPNVLTFQRRFVNAPNSLEDLDVFDTSSRFYGVNFGGRLHYQCAPCFIDLIGKVALGTTQQVVSINGQTTLVTPTGREVAPGGILAATTNSGRRSQNVFGVVPEVGFQVGVDAFKHLRLRAGYSFLLWNAVVRPGEQIDRGFNPSVVPSDQSFGGVVGGPARPAFQFRDEVFYVHTINLGAEFHY